MNRSDSSSEYLLLFRNTALEKRLPATEIAEAMRRLNEWLERGNEGGYFKVGQPLSEEGKIISGGRQRSIADGPFAEAKEAIGGFMLMEAPDLAGAMQIANDWPLLDYGSSIEVRPLAKNCASMELAGIDLVEVGGLRT